MPLFQDLCDKKESVAVVGLGYVGLPLAIALSSKFSVTGFDINSSRVEMLKNGHDITHEVTDEALANATVHFTDDPKQLAASKVIIVAVPTPVDKACNPDLTPVLGASRTVGKYMQKGCIVCYESTVYPGLTEESCVPVLEQESGLCFGTDFTVGYSPERINPGDKVNRLETICKVVAGSDEATADILVDLYGAVITAGIYRASSIKVAEAAKVIENTQRDINIALINELALIFDRMNIDTLEVLEAAGTKWNFLPFRPGLVGGHCIGVDPYYLTHKARAVGYNPEVILSGRRINDNMGKFIAEVCVKKLIHADCKVKKARVGVLGFTFKENVPDIRNSRVIDIVEELQSYGVMPLVHDPLADNEETIHEYNQNILPLSELHDLDALILAVGHESFKNITQQDIQAMFGSKTPVLLDIKSFWDKEAMRLAGFNLWRL